MLRTTARILTGLLIAGALAAVTAGVAAGQNASQATRNDSQGSITLKAVYLTAAYFKASPSDPLMGKVDPERNVVFAITLDTHAGDLSRYDFVKNTAMRNDRGQHVSPLRWVATVEGTHHRAGGLVFPKTDQSGRTIDAGTKTLALVVRDLGTVPERTLRWTLPVE